MSSDQEISVLQHEDSEDDFDWEEVEVPDQVQVPRHFEITISVPKNAAAENKKQGISHAERLLRVDCHKIHTIALIVNAKVRNSWVNDPLLQARLLSLTPLHLQIAFGQIHKSRVPDANQRGRMFERAMDNLVNWWANSFFEVLPEGHVKNRTFDEVQQQINKLGLQVKAQEENVDEVEPYDVKTLEKILNKDSERIRSAKSLMKHALDKYGSRDVSAQLFTALCRGLDIPARLVVSIQSVPWQASVGKPKTKYERKQKGKEKAVEQETAKDDSSKNSNSKDQPGGSKLNGEPIAPMSEKAKGKQKAQPKINLRKSKPKGNVLGAPSSSKTRLAAPDPLTTPPVFWTEVFSRADSRWFPVDPIRALVNKRKSFDPSAIAPNPNGGVPAIYQSLPGYIPPPTTQPRRLPPTKVENRMVYVVAFEEDGYARDVTRRYAREFGAKVSKVQGGSSAPNIGGGGKGRQAWWDRVVNSISRPYRLNRDDLEDQELAAAEMTEGMPSTIGGFKDHPIYVLTRHLKQTEKIHPPPPVTPELGKFRGEPVYPRSAVVSLKTAENWMRNTGRTVKAGEQPMKMVKIRAGTVNRMRELEVLKDELRVAGEGDHDQPTGSGSAAAGPGSEVMQGLYAFSQTEPYVPDPVVDGKVPKNNFGNIDLYVPSMLPEGAAHVPFKGVAKIARKLGFDYAEAVTGFEFKKRRAFPIIEGVVVAAENEAALLEAFWEAEREAGEKARIKREDRVFKNWTRLIHGLRIRQRLQVQYSSKPKPKETHQIAAEGDADVDEVPKEGNQELHSHDQEQPSDSTGGFLAGADRVVQAFHLPKNTHVVLPSNPPTAPHRYAKNHALPRNPGYELEEQGIDDLSDESEDEAPIIPDFITYDLDEEEIGADTDARNTGPASSRGTSMNVDGELMEATSDRSDAEPQQAARTAPKTMQELMDEHAAASAAAQGNVTVEEEIHMPGSPHSRPGVSVPAKDTRPSEEKPTAASLNKVTLRPRPKAKISTASGDTVADSSSVTVSDGAVPRRTQRQTRQAQKQAETQTSTETQTPTKANGTRVASRGGRAAARGKGRGRGRRRGGGASSPAKKQNQRGKKRPRADTDDEETEPKGGAPPSEAESDSDADMDMEEVPVDVPAIAAGDGDEPSILVSVNVYSADEDDIVTPPPNKRARRTRTRGGGVPVTPSLEPPAPSAAPATPASASTRTLRPRAAKSAAKLAEERKMEDAYRKAVAR